MTPYHPLQLNFWRYYIIQMRPYLLFVSGAAGLLGLAIGIARYPDISPFRLWLAFPPFFLAYGFGQALTDCFQTDTDRISAPERPLSKGLLKRKTVMTFSLAGLALSGGILIALHPINLLFSVLSVGGFATYTVVKRRFWWGGPPYNAGIVALLPVMGYYSVVSGLAGFPLLLLAMTFFSYANFVLMGYLKDIPADAATGYKTFPVVFGWSATVRAGHLLALASVSIFVPFLSEGGVSTWISWLLATILALAGQWHATKAQKQDQAASLFAITCTVRTFLLLQWAAIFVYQPDWVFHGILYYGLFEIALRYRYDHNQV